MYTQREKAFMANGRKRNGKNHSLTQYIDDIIFAIGTRERARKRHTKQILA